MRNLLVKIAGFKTLGLTLLQENQWHNKQKSQWSQYRLYSPPSPNATCHIGGPGWQGSGWRPSGLTWVMQIQAAPVSPPGAGGGSVALVGGECWWRPGGPQEGCCWRRCVQCMNSCIVERGMGGQGENLFILQ